MTTAASALEIASPAIKLSADLVSWDTETFGFPVAQIHALEIVEPQGAKNDYLASFMDWLVEHDVQLVSCRLLHDKLRESMFLEEHGFRFVEMVLHPRLETLADLGLEAANRLSVAYAEEADLPELQSIAERAFGLERYHVDPRFDPRLGDLRYARWVHNSFRHPRQRLLKIQDNKRLVAFFIVEVLPNNKVYWHLTAVSPQWQGQGYGRRAWQTMLQHHWEEGLSSVSTTISVRNIAVMNLYSSLNFRFTPPEMTFHWLRESA